MQVSVHVLFKAGKVICDMGIDGSTFVPKKWLIFTNLGTSLSQKVNPSFFLISEPILRAGFFKQEINVCP